MSKRKKSDLLHIDLTISFTRADMDEAIEWWEDMGYSNATSEEMVASAALNAVITSDFDVSGNIY